MAQAAATLPPLPPSPPLLILLSLLTPLPLSHLLPSYYQEWVSLPTSTHTLPGMGFTTRLYQTLPKMGFATMLYPHSTKNGFYYQTPTRLYQALQPYQGFLRNPEFADVYVLFKVYW